MKAKWNGVPGDPQTADKTEVFDLTFPKGKWVDIPDDLDPKFKAKLAANHVFEVEGYEPPAPPKPAPEVKTAEKPVKAK